MGTKKYSSPPCPNCESKNTVVNTYNTGFGSRQYKCKSCGRIFSVRFRPRKKRISKKPTEQKPEKKSRPVKKREKKVKPKPRSREIKKVKQISLPKPLTDPLCHSCGKIACICERLAREKKRLDERNAFRKKALNIDSIQGIPCVLCEVENRHCAPKCEILGAFLMGEIEK